MSAPTFAPRLNHVAITMPPGELDEAGRAEIKDFYGDVFEWFEGDNTGESGNPLILMTGQMQFVYLLPGDPALECPASRPLRARGVVGRGDRGDRRQGQGVAGEGRPRADHRRERALVRGPARQLRAHRARTSDSGCR